MRPQDCLNYEDCPRIDVIIDKDLEPEQIIGLVRIACDKCNEGDKSTPSERGYKPFLAGLWGKTSNIKRLFKGAL